ncbi:MAG: PQQ-binding-like beta-propeller repeat protein, partial [Acidobacteriota bacterium]|nr:PQQ-binding-like beta-propeller repeat protein [Acidobacteriota bacterium]
MDSKFHACRGRVSFGCLAAILLAGSLSAADWPMYLFNPGHSSFNADEKQLGTADVSLLQPAWTISARAPLASAVTVADGILYFGAWDGNFYAVNASDGSLIWRQFVGKAPTPEDAACMAGIGVSSQAVLVGDRVYVGGGDAALYALDKFTGAVVSRTAVGNPNDGAYIWSSITVSKGALYLG